MELIESDIETTSLQIAEMVGKEHKSILKLLGEIKKSVDGSGIGTLIDGLYLDERGEERPLYIMDKGVALFIALKFDDELRNKIIRGIREIEEPLDVPIPKEGEDAPTEVSRLSQRIYALKKQQNRLDRRRAIEELEFLDAQFATIESEERMRLAYEREEALWN